MSRIQRFKFVDARFVYRVAMRLWSLHPSLLDTKELLAVWREGLLAQKVLLEQTMGYRSHPQLMRFRLTRDPPLYIGTYLYYYYLEAGHRGYSFNLSKIARYDLSIERMKLTRGQLEYEYKHLLEKLKVRDDGKYREVLERGPEPHPLFEVVDGGVEPWEKRGRSRSSAQRKA